MERSKRIISGRGKFYFRLALSIDCLSGICARRCNPIVTSAHLGQEKSNMPRELWKGTINFGLVNIPVSLYPAEERQELSFTMLDRRDLSPVGYKRFNKNTGDEVAFEDIVKGYEVEKGTYVTLDKDDFRKANVEATQTVDIVGFVGNHDIPPFYLESPYYLAPDKHGDKGYALLREVLEKQDKWALATVV